MKTKVSVIIPCYYSENTIEKVVSLSIQEFEKREEYDYQFILVNDASDDGTFNKIEECCNKWANIIGIDLSINAGQHNAIMAGLKYASGDLVLCMDDDMQTHPSQILKLLTKIQEGYDLVFGTYPKIKENFLRRMGSKFNSATVNFLLGTSKHIQVTSFFVMRRFLRDSILQYKNSYTHLRGLLLNATSNVGMVEVEHFDREVGESTYTLSKLVRLWSSCINFSIIPLRFAGLVGSATAIIGMILAIFVVLNKLFNPDVAVGWTSTIAVILFFAGLILLCLGMIGEYIGRIFLAINNSPQYVIREVKYGKSKEEERYNSEESGNITI